MPNSITSAKSLIDTHEGRFILTPDRILAHFSLISEPAGSTCAAGSSLCPRICKLGNDRETAIAFSTTAWRIEW